MDDIRNALRQWRRMPFVTVFALNARDVETTALACVAVIAAATIATYLPARSAASTDPASVLKES